MSMISASRLSNMNFFSIICECLQLRALKFHLSKKYLDLCSGISGTPKSLDLCSGISGYPKFPNFLLHTFLCYGKNVCKNLPYHCHCSGIHISFHTPYIVQSHCQGKPHNSFPFFNIYVPQIPSVQIQSVQIHSVQIQCSNSQCSNSQCSKSKYSNHHHHGYQPCSNQSQISGLHKTGE